MAKCPEKDYGWCRQGRQVQAAQACTVSEGLKNLAGVRWDAPGQGAVYPGDLDRALSVSRETCSGFPRCCVCGTESCDPSCPGCPRP